MSKELEKTLEETIQEFEELEKPAQKFLVDKHFQTGGQA